MHGEQFHSVEDLQNLKSENLKKHSGGNADMQAQFKEEWESLIQRKQELKKNISKDWKDTIDQALNNQTTEGVVFLNKELERAGIPISPVLQSLLNKEVTPEGSGNFEWQTYKSRALTHEEIRAYKNDYIKLLKSTRDLRLRATQEDNYKNDVYVIKDGGKNYYDNNELSRASSDRIAHSTQVAINTIGGSASNVPLQKKPQGVVPPTLTLQQPAQSPPRITIPPAKVKTAPVPVPRSNNQPVLKSAEGNESLGDLNPEFVAFIKQVNEKLGSNLNPKQLASLISAGKRSENMLQNFANRITTDKNNPVSVPPLYVDSQSKNGNTKEYYHDMIGKEYLEGMSKNYLLRQAMNLDIDFDKYGGKKKVSDDIDNYESLSKKDRENIQKLVSQVKNSLKSGTEYNKEEMDGKKSFQEIGKQVFSKQGTELQEGKKPWFLENIAEVSNKLLNGELKAFKDALFLSQNDFVAGKEFLGITLKYRTEKPKGALLYNGEQWFLVNASTKDKADITEAIKSGKIDNENFPIFFSDILENLKNDKKKYQKNQSHNTEAEGILTENYEKAGLKEEFKESLRLLDELFGNVALKDRATKISNVVKRLEEERFESLRSDEINNILNDAKDVVMELQNKK